MADNYNPAGSLQFEKTDKHRLGRIKGEWEDAMMAELPEANERAWNQGAEEVTDGQVDSDAEVKAIAEWYRSKLNEGNGQSEAPAQNQTQTQGQPSQDLLTARKEWDDYEARRGEGSIHYDPSSGYRSELYADNTPDDYFGRFIPQDIPVPPTPGAEADPYEDIASGLDRSNIKDVYNYYSKKITELA